MATYFNCCCLSIIVITLRYVTLLLGEIEIASTNQIATFVSCLCFDEDKANLKSLKIGRINIQHDQDSDSRKMRLGRSLENLWGTVEVGQGVKCPTPYESSTLCLKAEYNNMREWIKTLKCTWKETGVR
ncbi:hypothetical protein Lal_00041627 [Lupinus albus]|nr:hypothetical protein Lal_00041627 [Lupinus albus]